MGLWRPTRPSRTNTPKTCSFLYRGLECKTRKSRNTWSKWQIEPWSTKQSRSKANTVLPREHTAHSKYSLPTAQEEITQGHHQMVNRKSDWLYSLKPKMEKLYIVSKNKTRSWLWLISWTFYCSGFSHWGAQALERRLNSCSTDFIASWHVEPSWIRDQTHISLHW